VSLLQKDVKAKTTQYLAKGTS